MKFVLRAALAVSAICIGSAAFAETIVDQRGTRVLVNGVEAADGQTFASQAFSNSADPAPFDLRSGSDEPGPNFDVSWTHSFTAPTDAIGSGKLLFGFYDIDSLAPGSQIAAFELNGFDLTAALNAIVEAKPYDSLVYGIYELDLPSTVFQSLLSGSASFRLQLKSGLAGDQKATQFNAGLVDFSRLTLTTAANPGVPEPATWATMLIGFAACGSAARLAKRTKPATIVA